MLWDLDADLKVSLLRGGWYDADDHERQTTSR